MKSTNDLAYLQRIASIIIFSLIISTGLSQTNCDNPLASAQEIEVKVKKIIDEANNSMKPHVRQTKPLIDKLGIYIDCAKTNQGPDSEDAKQIESIRNELKTLSDLKYEEWKKIDKDSLQNSIRRDDIYKRALVKDCPIEHYMGSDGSTIKTKITEAWKQDDECGNQYTILKIVIEGEDWTKEKGYSYSETEIKKYNQSYLDVAVISVPKNGNVNLFGKDYPDLAMITYYSITKDYINDGKVDYFDFNCVKIASSYVLKTKVK